jgi:hypothetical protein
MDFAAAAGEFSTQVVRKARSTVSVWREGVEDQRNTRWALHGRILPQRTSDRQLGGPEPRDCHARRRRNSNRCPISALA